MAKALPAIHYSMLQEFSLEIFSKNRHHQSFSGSLLKLKLATFFIINEICDFLLVGMG